MNYFAKLFILFAAFFVTGCTVVEPGYVGIKVNQYGTQKGVEDFPVFTGRQFYNPWTTNIYTWPTYTQRVAFGEVEGSPWIEVRAAKGNTYHLAIAVQYQLDPQKVPYLYMKYRKDVDNLNATVLPDYVKTSFNKFSSEKEVMEVLDGGLNEIVEKVTDDLKKNLRSEGFVINSVNVLRRPAVPEKIEASINAIVQAQQEAVRAEQELRSTKAEAAKRLVSAQAEADARLLEAKSQAEANKIIADSLNQYGDKVLQSKALDKWNGVLPQVQGTNATPFIQVK